MSPEERLNGATGGPGGGISRAEQAGITVSSRGPVQPEDAIELYASIGWGRAEDYHETKMAQALRNTTLVVSAHDREGKLVGLTRAVSDGVFYTAIADMVVHPDWQGQGIGRRMMEEVIQRFGHTGIYLEAFSQNLGFLEKCGLKKRDMQVMSGVFPEAAD